MNVAYQRELDIRPAYRAWSEDNIDLLAKVVAAGLRGLNPFPDDYLEFEKFDIAQAFDKLGDADDASSDAFDDLMDRLYNWGEQALNGHTKVCLVRIA
jgi:hypothetical protein